MNFPKNISLKCTLVPAVDNHRSLNILSLGCLYCLYKLKHITCFFRNSLFWPLYILEMADNVWIFKILQQIKSAILRNIGGMLFIVHQPRSQALQDEFYLVCYMTYDGWHVWKKLWIILQNTRLNLAMQYLFIHSKNTVINSKLLK